MSGFSYELNEIAKRKASIVALVQKYNELTLNEKTPAKDIKATQDALDKDLADYKVQAITCSTKNAKPLVTLCSKP